MADKNSVVNAINNSYGPSGSLSPLNATSQVNEALMKKKQEVEKKEFEKLQKDIKKFSDEAKEKYKFLESIGLCPTQANKLLEEEFEIKEEDSKRGLIHIAVIMPEKKYKDIEKIKPELIKIALKVNSKIWLHILSPVDLWNLGLDSKFDVFDAIAMSYPIYDKKGFLSKIRVAEIHKNLVLKKFEKYVTSYVIGGSFVVGDVVKESDVDTIIIIDDTDVKRMGRLELLEKLRGIIYSYIGEAIALGGAKIDLNVQVYLLTDFWDSVKDAHPVMFSFIRDGIPLYDRGAFMPWKALLKSGRIKPSPEAIEMFMKSGTQMQSAVDRKLLDIIMSDLYWSTITPAQGLLMLYGLSPGNVKETAKEFREVFVEREKLLEKKYADILEEVVIKYYKGYEHGKVKPSDINGKLIDSLVKKVNDFNERLKELKLQIEARIQETTIKKIYEELFGMLRPLVNEKEDAKVLSEFEKNYIKTGKFPNRYLKGMKSILKTKKDVLSFDQKSIKNKKDSEAKIDKQRSDVEMCRRSSDEIVKNLVEHTQRCDFLAMDRTRYLLKAKERKAEVFFLDDVFVVEKAIVKIIKNGKIVKADSAEFEKQLLSQQKKDNKLDVKALEILKKEFGEFELTY
jgi:predicted nucleotidyltransferase